MSRPIDSIQVGGWAHGHASKRKFYWQGDVENMARKWELLQKDVHTRLPGARQNLENFRLERRTLVGEVIEVTVDSFRIAVYILM
jgi:hypothetical protein